MERIDGQNKIPRSSNAGRLLFGFILLFIGGMMIARHFHWFDYDVYNIVLSWQMLLIAIGGIGLLTNKHNGINYILIFIGLFFMLNKVPAFDYEIKRLFWPFIFIFLGILILTRHGKFFGKYSRFDQKGSAADYIDDTNVFGGGKVNISTKQFRGGRITSIFGGSEYDFRIADLAEGISEIDIFHLFGGSKLLVPPDWDVKIDVIGIFGGFSDKRTNISDPKTNKKLYIKGLAVFGGGEIKSA